MNLIWAVWDVLASHKFNDSQYYLQEEWRCEWCLTEKDWFKFNFVAISFKCGIVTYRTMLLFLIIKHS
jgi:hypothetical protein